MNFLNPLDALPKIPNPIFFFSRFSGLGHLQGLGVRLSRILGVLSIEPFLGEGGGVRPEGSIDPPPPGNENPASPVVDWITRSEGFGLVPSMWTHSVPAEPNVSFWEPQTSSAVSAQYGSAHFSALVIAMCPCSPALHYRPRASHSGAVPACPMTLRCMAFQPKRSTVA